jgi:hypothetical protein
MACSYLSFLSLVISALHKLLRLKLNNYFFFYVGFHPTITTITLRVLNEILAKRHFPKKRDEILEKELVWGRCLKPITITVEAGKKRTGTTII